MTGFFTPTSSLNFLFPPIPYWGLPPDFRGLLMSASEPHGAAWLPFHFLPSQHKVSNPPQSHICCNILDNVYLLQKEGAAIHLQQSRKSTPVIQDPVRSQKGQVH